MPEKKKKVVEALPFPDVADVLRAVQNKCCPQYHSFSPFHVGLVARRLTVGNSGSVSALHFSILFRHQLFSALMTGPERNRTFPSLLFLLMMTTTLMMILLLQPLLLFTVMNMTTSARAEKTLLEGSTTLQYNVW
ncbi:hypothetical protein TRVL_01462 [Trypanosoma vivax]|uniref:Uncharacterized protein n=1 Tax=Trypanosoma vivax (strain Y486) TaxID=1055687 RepID=G0U7L0_TRYVY|nr:hypothetical protein TRVL_01462 [Trypanosoma vivax]CCC51868.1 hypothetical protein TVY486_1009130 [Trypanosoma vivax Y486]